MEKVTKKKKLNQPVSISKPQLLEEFEEVIETPQERRENNRETMRTVMILLFFSFLMFTLPFGTFYLVHHYLENVLHITGFQNTCWSVLTAVLTVNCIICIYVFIAYRDSKKEIAKEKLKSS